MTDSTGKLTSLVQMTIDSAQGYQRAADHAGAPELKKVLQDQAAGPGASSRRSSMANSSGSAGERQQSGTTSGAAHQIWTRITTAFKDRDEAAAERRRGRRGLPREAVPRGARPEETGTP